MRRVVLLLLVSAGCRDLLGIEEGTVGKDAAPPIDDMVAIDMPIDEAIDLDPDNDGIDDPADNCPTVANAGQQDFDGDARGDACDPCPHRAGPDADVDDDGDGLGVACDPRPLIGGDQRVLFVTFDNAADITGWTASSSSWRIENGTLDQTETDNQSRISLPGTLGDGYFAASADISAVGGAPYIGICTHLSTTEYLCCDLQSSATQAAMALSDDGQAGGQWLSSPYAPSVHVDFEQRVNASGFECTFREAGMTRTVPLADTRPAANLALHVRSTAARFQYVFFAGTP